MAPHSSAMTSYLRSFALHVDDVDRRRRFNEAVFGWTFEPWGPLGFYLIHTGDDTEGNNIGAMAYERRPVRG